MPRVSGTRGTAVLVAVASLVLSLLAPTAGQAVEARDAGWGAVERVSSHRFADDSGRARVEVATDGSAVAVWLQEGSQGGFRLYAARRSAGGDWSRPRSLSPRLAKNAWWLPTWDVAVGPEGAASVVWARRVARRVGDISRIEERHLVSGSWSPTAGLGRGQEPSVTLAGDGTALAVWGTSALNSARRAEGEAWAPPHRLVREYVREPTLDSNAAGDVVAAWWTRRAGRDRESVARAMVSRDGTWRAPRTVVISPYWEPLRGSVAAEMGPAGRAIVLFVRLLTRHHRYRNAVVWSRSHEDGTWSTTRFLTRDLLEDGGHVGLSMNASGQALAMWTCTDSDWSHVEVSRFRADATWGDPRRLPRGTWNGRPWLDDTGVAHVVTSRYEHVLAFRQRPEHDWTGPVRVGRGDPGDAAGRGDRMVAVWFTEHLDARVLDTG